MDRNQELDIEARKLLYHEYQENKRFAYQLQGDHGKWLIGSLLLIHGASFAFLAQSDRLSSSILPAVYWWHVVGLLLALACGFTTWMNWSLHIKLYGSIDPRMIYSNDFWPKWDEKTNGWIGRTYILSIVAGIGSAICVLAAATAAFCRMAP